MASDFRVSSRNENTDVRCMAEKAGGSGVLRHLDSPNDLMMVGGSGVIRHLDSPTDAMDLVEDGVGKGTCFCKGSPAAKLVNCQDVVPVSSFWFGSTFKKWSLSQEWWNCDGNETKQGGFTSLVKNTGTRI